MSSMNTNKHSKKVVHLPKFIQKNHTAILFSLLLFLMLPVTFVHAQRLYTTDGVNVRAKPNSSSKVLTSVSAGTSVTKVIFTNLICLEVKIPLLPQSLKVLLTVQSLQQVV